VIAVIRESSGDAPGDTRNWSLITVIMGAVGWGELWYQLATVVVVSCGEGYICV
jgi:hypothetical protein